MTKPKILGNVLEIFIAFLITMIFLEGINNLAPFFAIIIGFILGIADFIISYYWGYGIMSWLMELLPEPND